MDKKTSQKSERRRLSRLRPEQAKPAKEINHLAEFPAENPYPVIRIARDGTLLYCNQASSPILRQW